MAHGNHALDDHFFLARTQQVIVERGLTCVVETGLANGDSSVKFCGMVPRFIGIDIDPGAIARTQQNLMANGLYEAELYQGDSATVLAKIMPFISADKTLFFFDAHNYVGDPMWPQPTWPMPAEIATLPTGQGVLCLHDFHVPGKDFGVDGYWIDTPNGRVLKPFTYDLIKPALDAWSPAHQLEYMQESDPNSSYRGVAFVYPS